MQKAAITGSPTETMAPFTGLSQREREVFQLLGCGYGPSQTAEELQVSVKTVEGYLARIKKKLHIGDARTLRQHAIQQGRPARNPIKTSL
jgi:two-component system response regulator NreC